MDSDLLYYVLLILGGLLLLAGLLVVYRIALGPTTLDRVVGVDMITSIVIGAFSLLAALTRRSDLLPVFVVLAIIGFVGSTVVARFAPPLPPALQKDLRQAAQARIAQRAGVSLIHENMQQSLLETDRHDKRKYDANEEAVN